MKLVRTGLILNTENYAACVVFYGDVLGLEKLLSRTDGEDRLTCFDFGGAYLIVETGGFAKSAGKAIHEGCCKIRLNVADLEAARRHLVARGIAAEITQFAWGRTINLHDPDGNRVGIREEREFAEQVGL